MNTQLQIVFEIARYHDNRRKLYLFGRFFQVSLDISIEPQIIAHMWGKDPFKTEIFVEDSAAGDFFSFCVILKRFYIEMLIKIQQTR